MIEIKNHSQIKELTPLGTKEMHKCFDEKIHEVTVTDYVVKLYGDTYHNRGLMHELGFRWWSDRTKYWCKNVESYEELESIINAIDGISIRIFAEPIFRITDSATNPINC